MQLADYESDGDFDDLQIGEKRLKSSEYDFDDETFFS